MKIAGWEGSLTVPLLGATFYLPGAALECPAPNPRWLLCSSEGDKTTKAGQVTDSYGIVTLLIRMINLPRRKMCSFLGEKKMKSSNENYISV